MVAYYLFLGLATVGGTIMVCQFVLTLIGMGEHGGDAADDMPDAHDVGPDGADVHDESHTVTDHSAAANWLFGVITFRTVVAAATFFGLAGLGAGAAGFGAPLTFLVALATGGAAMYSVAYLMRALHRFNADGTIRISHAIGKTCTVYVPIPPNKTAAGKVQLNVQNRLVEYEALTDWDAKLPTGAKVVVTNVLNSRVLVVAPAPKPAPEPKQAANA